MGDEGGELLKQHALRMQVQEMQRRRCEVEAEWQQQLFNVPCDLLPLSGDTVNAPKPAPSLQFTPADAANMNVWYVAEKRPSEKPAAATLSLEEELPIATQSLEEEETWFDKPMGEVRQKQQQPSGGDANRNAYIQQRCKLKQQQNSPPSQCSIHCQVPPPLGICIPAAASSHARQWVTCMLLLL